MSDEKLRDQLRASFKNRAIIYYLIFDELRNEIGAERAEAVMKKAIYRRGEQIGRQFEPFGPADLAGLKEAFLTIIPDDGKMFSPNVVHCGDEQLDVQLEQCPLKEAWRELGLGDEELVTMCRIAGEIDKGTFEAAGFGFEPDTWKPGRSGCCHLHIKANRPHSP